MDIISDITNIPVDRGSFDAIMCIEVFEHLPNPVKAIEEFGRIVKTGGKLIITAPFCSFTHFAPFHFATGFNKYFYETHLKDNGFTIIEITPNGNYFEFLAQELRRLRYVAKLYSKKNINVFDYILLFFLLNKLQRIEQSDSKSVVI